MPFVGGESIQALRYEMAGVVVASMEGVVEASPECLARLRPMRGPMRATSEQIRANNRAAGRAGLHGSAANST